MSTQSNLILISIFTLSILIPQSVNAYKLQDFLKNLIGAPSNKTIQSDIFSNIISIFFSQIFPYVPQTTQITPYQYTFSVSGLINANTQVVLDEHKIGGNLNIGCLSSNGNGGCGSSITSPLLGGIHTAEVQQSVMASDGKNCTVQGSNTFDFTTSGSYTFTYVCTSVTTTTTTQLQCAEGNYRCDGENLEKCINGAWQFAQSCDYGCSADHCLPSSTSSSTTTTTTTTSPSQPLSIKCELIANKKYECHVNGTCRNGKWTLNNKQGTPLQNTLSFPIPGKAVFETATEGVIEVVAKCDDPRNEGKINLTVKKTKLTITGNFNSKGFGCTEIVTGYKCVLSYFNGLGENVSLKFFFTVYKGKNKVVIDDAGPYMAEPEFGNASTVFICSVYKLGEYTASWNAYKLNDTVFLTPIAWNKADEEQRIVC